MQWNIFNSRNINGFTFVPVTFPMNQPDALLIEDLKLQQLIDYINSKKIKKAYIQEMSNFDFIGNCPTLEHVAIELSLPFCELKSTQKKGNKFYKEYSLQSLYLLPHLKSLHIINNERPDVQAKIQIDLNEFEELMMYAGNYSYIMNIEKTNSLKTLVLDKYLKCDLTELSNLKKLDTLQLTFSKLQTLNGIENLNNLQCLYVNYNRLLQDISALRHVKSTLKALRIENCSKIEDFSVLSELDNLELLELSGSNVLPSLDFMKTMKNLKTFVFNMNVLDGDLSPCMVLSYSYSEKDRKHYNYKDKDLPKSKYFRGNEDIEEWRRLE